MEEICLGMAQRQCEAHRISSEQKRCARKRHRSVLIRTAVARRRGAGSRRGKAWNSAVRKSIGGAQNRAEALRKSGAWRGKAELRNCIVKL